MPMSNKPLEWMWFAYSHPHNKCYPDIDLCSFSMDVLLGYNFWYPACKNHDEAYNGTDELHCRWEADARFFQDMLSTVLRDNLINRMLHWKFVWHSRRWLYGLMPLIFTLGLAHILFGLLWAFTKFIAVRCVGWTVYSTE